MGVLAWIVGLLLAAAMAAVGVGKLRDDKTQVENWQRLGLPDNLFKVVGGLQVLSVPGLIIGLLTDGDNAEWLGFLAALGLLILMVGAVGAHARARDAIQEMLPAIGMIVLAVLYIVAIGGR